MTLSMNISTAALFLSGAHSDKILPGGKRHAEIGDEHHRIRG